MREFEQAVLDAAVAESQIVFPRLVPARAHELLEETLSSLARQGISKDAYLRITGKDEEAIAHEAEPEAGAGLSSVKRCWPRSSMPSRSSRARKLFAEALEPVAQRSSTKVETLLERLRSDGRLDRIRQDVATRQALDLLVREAKPISVEQAKAREKLWTPGKEGEQVSRAA